MQQFLICCRYVGVTFQGYKSVMGIKLPKISNEGSYFNASISIKGLSKFWVHQCSWHWYLLPQPKEEYFSLYVEGPQPMTVAHLLLSQLPSQQMVVGSVACFQEVHCPLCYVFGHVDQFCSISCCWSPSSLCCWRLFMWLQLWHSRCQAFSLRDICGQCIMVVVTEKLASFLVWGWNLRPWVFFSAGSLFRLSQIPFSDEFCRGIAGLQPDRVLCWRSITRKDPEKK